MTSTLACLDGGTFSARVRHSNHCFVDYKLSIVAVPIVVNLHNYVQRIHKISMTSHSSQFYSAQPLLHNSKLTGLDPGNLTCAVSRHTATA